jgi:dienelactone hydrolase
MNDLKTTKTDWIQIPLRGKSDKIDAFIAEPSEPPRGSLVMLQEIFGVNEAMREKARDFASAGFLVVVPDLFWRLQRRVDLGYSESERKQGFGLMQKFDQAAGAADVRDVISWLRKRSGHKMGVVGFCLGGRIAVLASANNHTMRARRRCTGRPLYERPCRHMGFLQGKHYGSGSGPLADPTRHIGAIRPKNARSHGR